MKINVVLPFTNLTGGIKVALEYCNRLSARENDVVIYIPMKAYKFNNKGIKGSFKIVKSSIGNTFKRGSKVKWFDLKVKIKLVPEIKSKYLRDSDIVVATAWPTAYDVSKLCESKGKKVYLIQHYEVWSGELEEVNGSYKLELNQIVIAKWLEDLMNKKFNKKPKLIYNGIDESEFLNTEKPTNKDIVVSMLYHQLEWKGFKDGLKAFEEARKIYPNIKLKLFGTNIGNDIPEYAEFYENPSREQLKNIYINSDIYIFPSRCEGWGLTIIESMACKCAVVGTNTGALSEVGINNKNALISDPEDVRGLTENLMRLIEDKELRNSIAKEGYNLALNFNWNKSIDNIEDFFKSLL